MSLPCRLFGWLTTGIWRICRVLLIAWATLAIYYSNLPWPSAPGAGGGLRGVRVWALWFSRRRRMSVAFVVLYLGVVAWWVAIPPSHDRDGGRRSR